MKRSRPGMALAVTVGLVSLIAILAVATLSLTGRLRQNSTIAIRDAELDAGVTFGLAAATDQWRQREAGRLAVGSSVSFGVPVAGVPILVSVRITRVGSEIFWVVARATSGGASRCENLVLRSRAPAATDLLSEDSTNTASLGWMSVDSLALSADVQVPGGSVLTPTAGFIHISGDATLVGGSGAGILIVDGRLVITGPLSYEGIIIARGGISATEAGIRVTGMIRSSGNPWISGTVDLTKSDHVVQGVMLQEVTPEPVAGRRWAELY